MTTGARMKLRRKEIGLSAEKVAMALGVSPATIYRYEKGDIEKVPSDVIEPLARILHTSAAYLMGWEDDPTDFEDPELIANVSTPVLEHFDGDVSRAIAFQKAVEHDQAEEVASSGLNSRDRRDIAKYMEEMRDRLSNGEALMFDGEPLTPEAMESILAAMQVGMEIAKKKNKEKYTPKKYRKE